MFEVTNDAIKNLKAYLEQNNIDSAIRIALMQGGWAGPSLGLALDEPKDTDTVHDQEELKFLVETSLMSSCGGIKVDFVDAGPRSGFAISSRIPLSGGGSSCGSCGSSCG